MKKVFVSGCFDVMHAGHVVFFNDAKRFGDHLTVCFASDEVIRKCKGREPSLPEDNKMAIIGNLKPVDKVLMSGKVDPIWDFEPHLKKGKYHVLAVTDDDVNIEQKRLLCEQYDMELIVIDKDNPFTRVSTTNILQKITGKQSVPLRVDLGGGWLDVPKYSVRGGFIVNCAIQPTVSLEDWPYEIGSGLGGSAAKAILEVKNGVREELKAGVGWQDPAIIQETGLCVWASGDKPRLIMKKSPDILSGKMALYYTGNNRDNKDNVNRIRDYKKIELAGKMCRNGVVFDDMSELIGGVNLSYSAQLEEGMKPLPDFHSLARKYCGGGWGGYALYIFDRYSARQMSARHNKLNEIEPYLRQENI